MDRRQFLNMTAAAVAATIAQPVLAGGHGRVAAFKKKNSYAVSGRAEIAKKGDGYVINLLDDFEFDGAPDPKIALGKNGYDKNTLMGLLKSNKGASSYEVPAGINPDDYNEVWIWCEQYNVPLAVASF
ncbi:DM13 domain-containing protein [uncultured Roseobacter sp.]|uniref:DM13 domain-containing protein n=1 Tax=uncultured Roseobacter sp. TaxID=114847 RepID=UPI0026179D56|nr:DM13 domain-containing protein [uncultured Roseobacter sp.]